MLLPFDLLRALSLPKRLVIDSVSPSERDLEHEDEKGSVTD